MARSTEAVVEQDVDIIPGYQRVRLLGRGGFGEVWEVTAPGGLNQALKIIRLDSSQGQGVREFRTLALVKRIRHPNLVPIIAFWLRDEMGKLFDDTNLDSVQLEARPSELLIAMGMGDKSLVDRLRECQAEGEPGIPQLALLEYLRQAARAIDFLNDPIHDLGQGAIALRHCAIKPQNLLLVGGGIQLCDFGLARVLGDDRVRKSAQSYVYSSPELLNGGQPSETSDQYSLAVTYFELRTGMLPFNTATPLQAIMAHTQGLMDLSRLPEKERQVVARALDPEPTKRWANCSDFIAKLRYSLNMGNATGTFKPVTSLKAKDSDGSTTSIPPGGKKDLRSNPDMVRGGEEIVSGYRAVKLLGRGGFGEVWEAVAPGGKHVAVKVVRNLEGTTGQQELKAMRLIKGITHNHLLEMHGFWLLNKDGQIIPDTQLGKAEEFMPAALIMASRLASQNLLQRLTQCKKQGLKGIPHDELLRYMWQAAKAIDFLNEPRHQQGERVVSIQHRDIKPQNILLAAGGVVKVADYGLSKALEGTEAMLHSASIAFTPQYTSPETFLNQVTQWSDQYSLAVTYYQLRTGDFPFSRKASAVDLISIHRDGRLSFQDVPPAERAVLKKATLVLPEQRYPTCSDFVTALLAVSGLAPNESVFVPSSVALPSAPPPRRAPASSSQRPSSSAAPPRPSPSPRRPVTALAEPIGEAPTAPRKPRGEAPANQPSNAPRWKQPPQDLATPEPTQWVNILLTLLVAVTASLLVVFLVLAYKFLPGLMH